MHSRQWPPCQDRPCEKVILRHPSVSRRTRYTTVLLGGCLVSRLTGPYSDHFVFGTGCWDVLVTYRTHARHHTTWR